MQTVVRVALGTFLGLWAFIISLVIIGRIFGSQILGILIGAVGG
jgi:hypothetical protein